MPVKKKIPLRKSVVVDVEETDDEQVDNDDLEEKSQIIRPKLVANFIRMWPRGIFSTPAEAVGQRGKRPLVARNIKELDKPGVYILYWDDEPYYVGQAKNLYGRLRTHANNVGSLRGYFWNYFSAFLVKNKNHIDEVEAILIAAMPSVITNGSKPKLPRKPMDAATRKVMRELRRNGRY